MTFQPSSEQQQIFDYVMQYMVGGPRDQIMALMIEALAGTGKTTTLFELAKLLPSAGSKAYCAFNKDIVTEAEIKFRGTGVQVKTFHSLGLSALKKYLGAKDMNVNDKKYRILVEAWAAESAALQDAITQLGKELYDRLYTMRLQEGYDDGSAQQEAAEKRDAYVKEMFRETMNATIQMLAFLRLKLIQWDDVMSLVQMIAQYRMADDINDEETIIAVMVGAAEGLMIEAERAVKNKQEIDYTDMIYWSVYWKDVRFYQFTWVFVDECQDLSPMQRALVEKIIYPKGGRIILVGDRHQAIYAFAGADSDSFDLSIAQFDAHVLPLSVTRRCDSIVAYHASQLAPEFTSLPEKPRGKVVWIDEGRLVGVAKPGDMVLSRIKSPLVGGCLELIGAGIPATILGNEIGKALVAILEKLQKREGYTFETVLDVLAAYKDEQIERYLNKGDEQMAVHVRDQCAAVEIVINRSKAPDIETLILSIEQLFSNKGGKDQVIFATGHKSKGLEADRVFIIAPDRLPLRFEGMTGESIQQEDNLDYVIRTRTKHTLVYLTNKRFLRDNKMPIYAQTTFDDLDWTSETLPQPQLLADNYSKTYSPTGENWLSEFVVDDIAEQTFSYPQNALDEAEVRSAYRRQAVPDDYEVKPNPLFSGKDNAWDAGVNNHYAIEEICKAEGMPHDMDWLDWRMSRRALGNLRQQIEMIEVEAVTIELEPEPPTFRATGNLKRDLQMFRAVPVPKQGRLVDLVQQMSVTEIDTMIALLLAARDGKIEA